MGTCAARESERAGACGRTGPLRAGMPSPDELALPAALWVSQTLDYELRRVPKSERRSLLRLIALFSESSVEPEASDNDVLRRSFKAISAAYVEQTAAMTQLQEHVGEVEGALAFEREQAEAERLTRARELKTLRLRGQVRALVMQQVWTIVQHDGPDHLGLCARGAGARAALRGVEEPLHGLEAQLHGGGAGPHNMDYPTKDDPNHGCNAFPEHQMTLITSGCVPFRSGSTR